MRRLAIISTHPIQYNAPLFRLLSERKKIAVTVYYTWGQSKNAVYDGRFGIERSWDIPLLEGYKAVFVNNTAKHPDSNRFFGVINPGFKKHLQAENYDAILIYRWSIWSHFLLLQCLDNNQTLFFRGDSHMRGQKNTVKTGLKKLLLRFVYRNVKKAFIVGTYNKAYMKACGLQDDQLIEAPHAIDMNRFSANAEAMENEALLQRKALGIPDNSVVFLYAGKFYDLKDLSLLINAFKKLNDATSYLILIGNGEQEKELRKLAENNVRIHFLPFQNQSAMPWVYRLGDVFVLPSKSETWGLSINESMACGRTVIVSDSCGCAPDLIVQGETGFVFTTADGDDLLYYMKQVAVKPIAQQMGRKSLAHIQYYSLERIAEAIEGQVSEV